MTFDYDKLLEEVNKMILQGLRIRMPKLQKDILHKNENKSRRLT